ncbi:MAG: hypothetical protein GX774_13415 [Armatimonadetes bacterium]|nr:hypothetical protein [Armatimonadota bacterium]
MDQAVEEFLEGRPRAKELAELRRALETRAEGLKAALGRAQDPAEQDRLRKELQVAERQIAALEREELITEFVEDSVRATVSWSQLKPEEDAQ